MDQNKKEYQIPVDIDGENMQKITTPETEPDFESNKETAEINLHDEEFTNKPDQKKPVLPIIKNRPNLANVPARDEITKKVEKIMSEGLEEAYHKLPPVAQQEFKLKGEQTAAKIREMLKSAKVKFKQIFKMIFEWLSILPNINRFFLEQEAKIKTDKIILLKKIAEEKK